MIDAADSPEHDPTASPRLPVYLDGELLETLAQTLDPSGVPGTRRVRFSESGRTLEGSGYALRASGRIGSRLLGAQAGGERSRRTEDEARDDQTEEQEFVVREATLLWQAHSILAEEGHLKRIDSSSIGDLQPGDWVELRTRATGRSLLSLSRLLARIIGLQSEQGRERLDRLREGESLLRGSKVPSGTKIGDRSLNDVRQAFLSNLITSLAAASDEENLQATAAMEGLADELLSAVISDIRTEFVDPALQEWTALLTVRTEDHNGLANGALYDSEFGVFGKVTLVRTNGEPIRLVRRTMLDWMEASDLESLSSELETTMGGDALTVRPPLLQVLPLALWV
jgi:hypothetical protein